MEEQFAKPVAQRENWGQGLGFRVLGFCFRVLGGLGLGFLF